MILVVTKSRYWFKRYCKRYNIDIEDARQVDSQYSASGYNRDTQVVLTNGSNLLDVSILNRVRERFDTVIRDME